MSGQEKDVLNPSDRRPTADDETSDADDAPPKSYYYDDATGYEIYQDEPDDEGDEAGEASGTDFSLWGPGDCTD